MSGFQVTDFLSYLGFQRSDCSFTAGRQCYVRWVSEAFDLARFAEQFDAAFSKLTSARGDLEACGLFLDQPEGWGYFFGGHRGASRRDLGMTGDGHLGSSIQQLKASEDEIFAYKLTWLDTGHHKGWVFHHRPKHFPLSSELESVFKFFHLNEFTECPEFDFEACHWRSVAHVSRGDGFFDSNTEAVHRWFDAHATRFSPGVQKALGAQAEIEKSGLGFLPFASPAVRLSTDIERKTARPIPISTRSSVATPNFDVAISFAGTEREQAEQLATILKGAGISVFYDDFFPEFLWGKNLVDTFDEIFRKRARYCVIFISKEYKERLWTNHERQSAQARALTEKGKEYILPIKVDETELDGMPPTVGHVPISKGVSWIGEVLIKKVKGSKA